MAGLKAFSKTPHRAGGRYKILHLRVDLGVQQLARGVHDLQQAWSASRSSDSTSRKIVSPRSTGSFLCRPLRIYFCSSSGGDRATPGSGLLKKLFKSTITVLVLALGASFLVYQEGVLLKHQSPFIFSHDRMASFPRVILWAWERPEDLTFIDPQKVGVAFLAKTITLREKEVIVRPRVQPLSAPQNVRLMAVVRIESDPFESAILSAGQLEETALQITQLNQTSGIGGIQIDFDAKKSERDFYAQLLRQVRERIPRSLPLSITALASWCMGDPWINNLPIDEAVPMLFRMGPDGPSILLRLESGGDFKSRYCRTSLGFSTDEPIPRFFPGRRIYIFNPRPWTESDLKALFQDWNR